MKGSLKDRYYSGREVQKILGITEPSLRNLVNQKKIRKVIPPGRQNGLYLRSEIDAFAEKWEAFLLGKEEPKTAFLIAKPEDMEGVYELSKRSISPGTMNAATRLSWLTKNPESCFVVKHGKEVVAFFHLLPLEHQCITDFMEGKIRGWDITGEHVKEFSPDTPIECLAIVASDPDVNETTRMHYMLVLLRGLAGLLKDMGRRGVVIEKIYATSETPTGIAMAMHIGMEEIPPRIGKRVRFELDTEKEPRSFLIRNYQEGLAEWNKQQSKQRKKHTQSDRNTA